MMRNNRFFKAAFFAFIITFLLILPDKHIFAKALDEIIDYSMIVDVNDDTTLNITYNISWKVLDSSSEGPLSWVSVGLPNSNFSDVTGLTSNIKSISTKNSGGTFAEIYFDRDYYADEIAVFSFSVTMDKMYSAYPDEGYAEYVFTPGWYDEIAVDNMTILWENDDACGWSPDCLVDDGYNMWTTSLKPGEKYTVKVQYPIDALAFDTTMRQDSGDSKSSYKYSEHSFLENVFFTIFAGFAMIVVLIVTFSPFIVPFLIIYLVFKKGRGFKSATAKKQITRTIVEYYPSCPNCGGTREEGKEICSYCSTNMIKSKREITEEDAKDEDKDIFTYNTEGEYKYSSNPNRYVRVHVVPVPVPSSKTSSSIRSTSGRGSSGSHHSSCAHSSCACACACACAGGGRAGCSTKDFYNTRLKLSNLNPDYLKKIKHK